MTHLACSTGLIRFARIAWSSTYRSREGSSAMFSLLETRST